MWPNPPPAPPLTSHPVVGDNPVTLPSSQYALCVAVSHCQLYLRKQIFSIGNHPMIYYCRVLVLVLKWDVWVVRFVCIVTASVCVRVRLLSSYSKTICSPMKMVLINIKSRASPKQKELHLLIYWCDVSWPSILRLSDLHSLLPTSDHWSLGSGRVNSWIRLLSIWAMVRQRERESPHPLWVRLWQFIKSPAISNQFTV